MASNGSTTGATQSVQDQLALAQTRAALAEASKLEAESTKAVAEAEIAKLALVKRLEDEQDRLADNKFHHIYVFNEAVTDIAVDQCIDSLDKWRRTAPECDVTLRIYSPGGDVIAGMYLFDYLQGLRRDGHKLRTEAYGFAASMGGILLQAGDERFCGTEAYILIHQPATSVRGKIAVIDDEVQFVHKISDRVLDIFATRAKEAGEKGTAKEPLSRAQFKKRWERKDWWLSSDEALEYGVVDEVG